MHPITHARAAGAPIPAFASALVLTLSAVSGSAPADLIEVAYDAPSLDRWMYPFNATPGVRFSASTFGTFQDARFDNRDGQLIVAYTTAGDVPPGLGADRYRVLRARLTLQNDQDLVFVYDDTQDPYEVFLDPDDTDRIEDADPGQPMELYGTGFRNGMTRMSFQETTPYTFGDPLGQGIRNAFAIDYDAGGAPIDVSLSVLERFDPAPWAIGTIDGLAPGARVPLESDIVFDVAVADPDVAGYLAESLDAGRLFLTVTSLTVVAQQEGDFPQFYCKESPLVIDGFAFAARLELDVEILEPSCDADLDGDGTVGFGDVVTLLSAWGPCDEDCPEDLDDDDAVGFNDLLIVLGAWGPCP